MVISGEVSGRLEAVPVYSLSVKLGTEGAGKVSATPVGNEFDEGTAITVTASENFGYHFAAWIDQEGNVVSTQNPYTFEITANTTLLATYTRTNVYALNLSRSEGANENLVLSICLGDDHNTYSVNNVEYSTDGSSFTKIGEFNPPARA